MFVLGIICVIQIYKDFDSSAYNTVYGCLDLFLLLKSHLLPTGLNEKPKRWEWYSTKSNLWIAIHSFTRNHWYTHYFYNIMNVEYTMTLVSIYDDDNKCYFVLFPIFFCSFQTSLNNVLITFIFETHFIILHINFNHQ